MHRTEDVVLIQGRRLLTFQPHVQRLIEGGTYIVFGGGAYSSKYGMCMEDFFHKV